MYNVESYVERCIRSLEDQDIPENDFEIICINDGSPDNSKGVVINMQKEFENIILIDQENQGVSRARNNGINKAEGKYLLFIDPDDYVDPGSFRRVLNKIKEKNAQVSFLGFTFLNADGSIRKSIYNESLVDGIYPGTKAYFLARSDGNIDPDRMVAVLFETDFINRYNLRYLHDVPYLEDGEFLARIMCLAKRCIFDGASFYQRTTRYGSATNSRLFQSEKATKGFLIAVENLNNFRKNSELEPAQKEFLNQPVLKFALLAVNSAAGFRINHRLILTIRHLKKLSLRRISTKGCNRLYRFYGSCYNISPYLAAFILVIYPRLKKISQILKSTTQ